MSSFSRLIAFLFAALAITQVIHVVLLLRLGKLVQEEEEGITASQHEQLKSHWVSSLHRDASGEYLVDGDFITPSKTIPHQAVTMVTQCSVNHLHQLPVLASRWGGPTSVAVFVLGDEVQLAQRLIRSLLQCSTVLNEMTSFHLVYVASQLDVLPEDEGRGVKADCADVLSEIERLPGKNYARQVPYPNNVLRNVARDAVETAFVFVVDVDMLCSQNLHDQFVAFAKAHKLFSASAANEKTAYVVPAFEARRSVDIPPDKSSLMVAVRSQLIRPFYVARCWKCHKHTDYDRWYTREPSTGIKVVYDVDWKDAWEPFYIARRHVPRYDERFKQYGFNRISNVCQLHMAGYTFSVLDNAFLVHQGFKEKSAFHKQKDAENDRNRELFRIFKDELLTMYSGTSRRCV